MSGEPPNQHSHAAQAIRGAGILFLWLLTPLALGSVAPSTSFGFVTLLVWQWSVFPHAITYVGPGHAQLVWSHATASSIAASQWVLVAAAFGWLTRQRRWALQVGLAPVAIIVTVVCVLTLLRLLGYVVFQALP